MAENIAVIVISIVFFIFGYMLGRKTKYLVWR